MLYHLYSEHAPDGCLPEPLDVAVWCDMFVTRAEESALGIENTVTIAYRRMNGIPDSDDLPQPLLVEVGKRRRSDSTSTAVPANTKRRARFNGPDIQDSEEVGEENEDEVEHLIEPEEHNV
jgi:hypothetical protein